MKKTDATEELSKLTDFLLQNYRPEIKAGKFNDDESAVEMVIRLLNERLPSYSLPWLERWIHQFDERQQQEIKFCLLYAREFHHGTVGHNEKMIIAKMAAMLNELYQAFDQP